MAASEKDIQDVIRTLIAEGIGEGEEGMRRIAETILNRAEQRGISPAEVVRQRAQYTGYSNPGPGAVQAMRDPNAITAAQAAWQMAQGPDDPTNGANHYWNPNIVSPSWAGSMQSLGQFGNHAFATDMPNWQRPAPPVAPAPLMRSSGVNASQAMTSPSGGNGALQIALDQMATRERNRVTPASVEDRVTARNRVPTSVFGDDPMTPAQGGVVARIPSTPSRTPALQEAARRAALTMNQSYAGQERGEGRVSQFNGDPMTAAAGSVVATIPSKPSLLQASAAGGPPMTRAVPTTTVRPLASAAKNIADARSEQAAQRVRAPVIPDRLPSSPAGLPALYGTMTPQQVSQIGVPSTAPPAVTPMRNTPAPLMAASRPRVAPVPASVAQMNVARNGSWQGNVFTPPQRPITSAFLAQQAAKLPLMAQSQQPLTIRVQGSNTIQAAPRTVIPAGPTAQQRVDFGNWATRNSGDNSSGSQAEAAQARSSGDGGRIRRY